MLDELLDDEAIEELLGAGLLERALEDELFDDSDETSIEDDTAELLDLKELLENTELIEDKELSEDKELIKDKELLEATELIILELEVFVIEELESLGLSVLATQPASAKPKAVTKLALLNNILVMRISN